MSKSKKTNKKPVLTKNEMRAQVQAFLQKTPGAYYSLKQLFRELHLTSHPAKMVCVDLLNEMLEKDEVVRNEQGEVSGNLPTPLVEGIYHRTSGGRNFVDLPDGTGISIYDEHTRHALPGDRVRVQLNAKKHGSKRLKGRIVEIVERSGKPYVGTLQIAKHAAYLLTPTDALPYDIMIPLDQLKGAQDGDKVAVNVLGWPADARNPRGEITVVLGPEGDNNTEMHAILAEYGLPTTYPESVEKAAQLIDPRISAEELARREDFRSILTFTIDPRDAKDFDDAISIQPIADGLWQVGVHIADVSHYVTEGSIIDKEAQKRATSVYLVDRTIPMLPERLCNFICSLRPNEEKLAYSAIFDITESGEVKDYHIAHTVIKSDRRFAYEEVQYLFEQIGEASPEDMQTPTAKPAPVLDEDNVAAIGGKHRHTAEMDAALSGAATYNPLPAEHYQRELVTLNHIAKALRAQRFKKGAIGFDREEVRFDIDADGHPTGVYFKRAKDANKLVEEFMLLANRTVAESVGKVRAGTKAKVLPYRIHDMPDPTKLENLSKFVSRFNLRLNTLGSKTDVAKSINRLLADVKGMPIENLVEVVSLRAMMKAKYSTVNIGHYGLAFDYYTHFTSPIRRYPDLMVHRLLTRYAEGGRSASQSRYEALCEHSSEMEQLAANAERASIKYKQVEYMSDKLGQEFDATISGVTDYGFYAEIDENKCEGLVSIASLGNEPYDFDEQNYSLVARVSRRRFAIGDKVRIQVAKANLIRKQLDFELVRPLSASSAASGGTAPKEHFSVQPAARRKKDNGERKKDEGEHKKSRGGRRR